MINKGTSCAGAFRLAKHITRTDTNERAEVKEIRGVVSEDIFGALREMEAVACGARTTKPFYHASINTIAHERMTDEQRAHAVDKLEAALGLTGQPRVVVVHEKKDREHCHIVWSRIDIDRMAAISDSHNFRKHEEVARSLEREFGFERVQGVHVERDGKPRPERTPSHHEMLQAERTGISTDQAKEMMTGIWKATKDGTTFQAALEEKGWTLARGDRLNFVAMDPHGGVHSIARRIEGAKAADVRLRFADLDPGSLPSVAEAKQVQREHYGDQRTDRIGVSPTAAKAAMTELWRQTGNGKEFQAGLEQKWFVLAKGDRRDFVAVDIDGGMHNIARRVEGAKAADVRQRFADLDPKSLPTVAEAKKLQRARQAERQSASEPTGGLSPAAGKAAMTELWQQTKSGKEFQAALETKWWVLARGDQREFVAIDSAGGVHSVARRLDGVKAADIRQRFADLDPKSLPTVAEARKLQEQRQGERAQHAATSAQQRAKPEADQGHAAAGPRQRAPGIGRAARPAAKIAGSILSALMGETPSPKPKEPESPPHVQEAGQPSQRRQELMRQLSREIPQETERDAEIERDRGRERDRG